MEHHSAIKTAGNFKGEDNVKLPVVVGSQTGTLRRNSQMFFKRVLSVKCRVDDRGRELRSRVGRGGTSGERQFGEPAGHGKDVCLQGRSQQLNVRILIEEKRIRM